MMEVMVEIAVVQQCALLREKQNACLIDFIEKRKSTHKESARQALNTHASSGRKPARGAQISHIRPTAVPVDAGGDYHRNNSHQCRIDG